MIFLSFMLLFSRTAVAQDTVAIHYDTTRVREEMDSTAAGKGADEEASGHVTEKTDSVIVRSIPDSVRERWRNDKDFAYANDPGYWRREYRQESPTWSDRLLSSRWLGYSLLFVLGCILLYAIIRIISDNNLRLFYRSPGKKTVAAPQEEPGPLDEDLDGQLLHFLQIKDHRQAVRYLYLKALRLLNDRGLIRFQHQQQSRQALTNREYVQQLGTAPQREPFSNLTGAYEKVWYGGFPLNDTQFGQLHRYFEDFYKTCRP